MLRGTIGDALNEALLDLRERTLRDEQVGVRSAQKTVNVPVLVAYGLVGRYTMADLQEDRSLIRNLLAQGVDLYAVDWGEPSRADRWLRQCRPATR